MRIALICEASKTVFCETRKTVIYATILFSFVSFHIVSQNGLSQSYKQGGEDFQSLVSVTVASWYSSMFI